jgi:hypothetical protein
VSGPLRDLGSSVARLHGSDCDRAGVIAQQHPTYSGSFLPLVAGRAARLLTNDFVSCCPEVVQIASGHFR